MGVTRKLGLAALVAAVAAGGGLAFTSQQAADQSAADAGSTAQAYQGANAGMEAGVQPIAFPHNVHANTYQIDCAYCHFSAERSVDAGIPPVSTCMGCHTMVGGQEPRAQEGITALREYWTNQEQIPWVRIHKVADHVSFPHMRHIQGGLDCTECHGPVQEMGVWQEPDPTWGSGKMGWCISCHVERDVSRDCTVCHY